MTAASAIAQVVAGLFAVHGVSWAFSGASGNAAFVPASLLPLVSAPIWAPVEAWCEFMSAGILLAIAIAVATLKHKGNPAPVWIVAAGEAVIVSFYYIGMYTDGNHGGGWITHLACALVAAALVAVGWIGSK